MFKNISDIRNLAKLYDELMGYVKDYLTKNKKWNGYTEIDNIEFAVDQDYIEVHLSGFFGGAWDNTVTGIKYSDIIDFINNNNKSFNVFNYGEQ